MKPQREPLFPTPIKPIDRFCSIDHDEHVYIRASLRKFMHRYRTLGDTPMRLGRYFRVEAINFLVAGHPSAALLPYQKGRFGYNFESRREDYRYLLSGFLGRKL